MSNASPVHEAVEHLYAILKTCGADDNEIMKAFQKASKTTVTSRKSPPRVMPDKSRLHIDATTVVAMWRRNPRFLDGKGDPAPLPISDDILGFRQLVAQSRVSSTVDQLLPYLIELGIVFSGTSGHLELREESVLVVNAQSSNVVSSEVAIGHVCDFLRTVRANLSGDGSSRPKAFERACYGRVQEDLIPIFNRLVKERGQQYVDMIDEWLDRHPPVDQNRTVLVGSGAYAIIGSNL